MKKIVILIIILSFSIYTVAQNGSSIDQVNDTLSTASDNSSIDSRTYDDIARQALDEVRRKNGGASRNLIFNPVKPDDDTETVGPIISRIAIFSLGILTMCLMIFTSKMLNPRQNTNIVKGDFFEQPLKFNYIILSSIIVGILIFGICLLLFKPFRYNNWYDHAIPVASLIMLVTISHG